MALGWQALAAKKAWKAFETCEALEQVAARIERVMGLTKVVEQCGAKRHVARTKGSATLERGTQKT